MKLSKLEQDFLGDMSRDTHGVWEVFRFVQLHHPKLGDKRVFQIGRKLLDDWISRGWIRLSPKPLHPSNVTNMTELQELLDKLNGKATEYFKNAPSIDLTEKAITDTNWLL